jgi:PHD-finger
VSGKMALAGKDRTKGSESKELDEDCGECGNKVVKEAVECEVCERWFHIKCVGVAVGAYKVLGAEKSLHWFCKGCDRGVVNTWKKLQERQEKLKKSWLNLERR